MPAVLTLSFDPVLRLGETASIRIETAVLAAVLFCGLVLAVRMGKVGPAPGLRIDDLVFMVVGAVPGVIVGGRIGYVLDHLAFYQANPSLITDPAQGGFTLTLAVPLGMLSGAIIGRLLGAPIGRWMHALALPLLFVLGAGKLAGVLGGTGQGLPTDAAWATAYAGPGPWGSLAADLPSHPSQIYEGALVGLSMLVFWPLSRLPQTRRESGVAIWIAVALWCAVRFVVGFTWRDQAVLGGLGAEQLLALGVGLLALGGVIERSRRAAVADEAPAEAGEAPTEAGEAPGDSGSGAAESTAGAAPETATADAGSPDGVTPGAGTADAETLEGEAVEPQAAEPGAVDEDGPLPEATEPKAAKPRSTKPAATEAGRRSRRRTRGRVSGPPPDPPSRGTPP